MYTYMCVCAFLSQRTWPQVRETSRYICIFEDDWSRTSHWWVPCRYTKFVHGNLWHQRHYQEAGFEYLSYHWGCCRKACPQPPCAAMIAISAWFAAHCDAWHGDTFYAPWLCYCGSSTEESPHCEFDLLCHTPLPHAIDVLFLLVGWLLEGLTPFTTNGKSNAKWW